MQANKKKKKIKSSSSVLYFTSENSIFMHSASKKLRDILVSSCPGLSVTLLGACETREWLMLGA